MKIVKPQYYDRFRCIADRCPDSCCHQWQVDVDEEAASRYLAMPGQLGDALRQKLRQSENGWYLENENDRCPMWRADGLCSIQCALGHDALCQTCRDFPRLRHDYGDFVELMLEMSCPEAARLILAEEAPLVTAEVPGGDAPDYDPDTMAVLLYSREKALDILRRYDLPRALQLLLVYGAHAQADVDAGEVSAFDEEAALELSQRLAAKDPAPLAPFYEGLEILTRRWQDLLAAPAGGDNWPAELTAFARYGIFRYWLQAVSDWELQSRVKMIVSGCILVRELGGDVLQTAQIYAKEIENDPDNIDAILDGAYTSPCLTDANLLGWLTK